MPQLTAMILSGLLIFATASTFYFAHGRVANFIMSEGGVAGMMEDEYGYSDEYDDDYSGDFNGGAYEDFYGESGDDAAVDPEVLRQRLKEIEERSRENSEAADGDDYDPYNNYYDYD